MKMACPNCGANIIYIFGTEFVYCEHCNQKIDVSKVDLTEYTHYIDKLNDQIKEKEEKKNDYVRELFENNSVMQVPHEKEHVFKCPSCNSEFVHSDFVEGEKCPYCLVKEKSLLSDLKDYKVSKIIPFEISKNIVSNIVCNAMNTYEFGPENVFAMYIPVCASYDEVKRKRKSFNK